MSLKQTIEMLSKGSAQAVSTLKAKNAEASKLKDYLYVRTPVEKQFVKILDETVNRRIIFLCGSSGDGKSEIFRRHCKKYKARFDFHLDATHSYDPAKDAIQTLNDKFAEYKATNRPLVVGVNIGALGNFAADGDNAHADIKASIELFLANKPSANEEHVFINFEDHPKFVLNGDKINSPFIAPLFERICAKEDKNPIYVQSQSGNLESNLHRNYKLLCLPEVQQRICSLLFYAHLQYDQFLTARTLLDFVYQILTGKNCLFDNIFCGQGTDLFDSLRMLDPSHARSKTLDLFQVKASLNLFEPEFKQFKIDIEKGYGLILSEPRSWVRLFYVMQDVDLSNNFHKRFRSDLQHKVFDEFCSVWQLHRDYNGAKDERKAKLYDFYNNTFIAAISNFANRFAPEVPRNHFLLAKPNGYALSATSGLKPDLNRLATERPKQLRSFDAYLKTSVEGIPPVQVSVSFFELAKKINSGYRPNTHDKTTVFKLEELVEVVRRIVRQTDVLYVQSAQANWKLINESADDEISVES